MKKRIFGLLLAVCLAVTALAAPAAAFTDVTDAATAVDVECLRLMGVLDGYADGSFRPDATLTRAQFCKMAVYALNAQKELGKYRSVTVFPDVKPSHWAAPYINLASKGKGVILGFADGKFHPEARVTAGQAVTILMRQLGYKDEDVGAVWPDGYLAQAEVTGLTDGLHLSGGAALTRGQAARLFVNLLRCDKADGSSYASGIADQVLEPVMLVSSAAAVSSGDDTGMQTGSGTVYQMANKASNGLLNGRMGMLLLDSQGKVLTFVPDGEGTSRTVVLVQAKSNSLLSTAGEKFALDSDTAMYYDGEETTWGAAFSWLKPGMSLTLYLGTSGGVEYVFAGSGVAADQAVVVYADGSTAGLDALTGGSLNYKITKNGAAAGIGDLRAYDVVTYSGATNTLQVCDVRLSGIYESCSPTPDAPETITVMGHDFRVLPSAAAELAQRKVGDAVTLLLTADNQVAGVMEGSKVRGNALGIVRAAGDAGEVELLCGITVKGAITGKSADLAGQLVRVSSGKRNTLSVGSLTGGVSGDLKAADRTLGGVPLADNVVIYRTGNSGLEAVALTGLPSAVVARDQIRYAGTDWAGRVNLIVLGDKYSTVDYIYGRAVVRTNTDEEGKTTTTIAVEYGNGQQAGPVTSKFDEIRNGQYVRASLSAGGSDFSSLLALKKLASVSNSAWTGRNAVTVGGRTYTVGDDVPCFNAATQRWVTLDEAHAFAAHCDLYADSTGTVRVIEVDQ
ncbi:S-layer homology domain-containing protein [Dysosmobacter sp.]|uniref:S-layer homology domain-containing protein n=1 Tax=Dysosmobacter sp. TaxID=2591382 RepID=UPI002A8D5D30|nr:S-layer homology domain-containing protein [Dysosmobacter sp.]MDY3281038.1 S-layer homology domain-containing protein [Dysosmobacter sp.]